MDPLPDEYHGFNPRYLAFDKPWIIILVETLRYKKAFPKRGRIQEYDLRKLSDTILAIASNNVKPRFGGSFRSYMKRFSTYDPYRNEKYYTRIATTKRGRDAIFYRYNIPRIEQKIEAERRFSFANYTAILSKHGIPAEDLVSFEVRDSKGRIKKAG